MQVGDYYTDEDGEDHEVTGVRTLDGQMFVQLDNGQDWHCIPTEVYDLELAEEPMEAEDVLYDGEMTCDHLADMAAGFTQERIEKPQKLYANEVERRVVERIKKIDPEA